VHPTIVRKGGGENRAAIIGGGLTGMALAYRLACAGQQVTVFEREKKTGGLAGSFEVDRTTIDKYYRHIFPCHSELLDVIHRQGLEERLIFRKASMAYFSRGEIHPLNSITDMLRFAPLSLPDRLRVGLSASALLLNKKWESFDGRTVEDYLMARCGPRGYRAFWEPLLKNKFGDYHSCISAVWFWDRLASRAGCRRVSGESLGYLEGGVAPLLERMQAEIEKWQGQVIADHAVESILPAADGSGSLVLNDDRRHPYSACIVTLPLPQFGSICPTLPDDYRSRLAGIDYSHSVCMVVRLQRPLSSHYWINIGDTGVPFMVVVEHTNWMDRERYGGWHVAYLSRYVQNTEDFAWTTPDRELFALYCGFLKKIFKDFHESQVHDFFVFRDRYTQPIFKRNYSRIKPPFVTPLKNLFLANSSQFYPRSRCMNTSFLLAAEFTASWTGGENGA
jgi:protoporphyrinogen oxidase